VRGSTDDSCPEGGQGVGTSAHFNLRIVFVGSRALALMGRMTADLRGEEEEEDSSVIQTSSFTCRHCLVGLRGVAFLFHR